MKPLNIIKNSCVVIASMIALNSQLIANLNVDKTKAIVNPSIEDLRQNKQLKGNYTITNNSKEPVLLKSSKAKFAKEKLTPLGLKAALAQSGVENIDHVAEANISPGCSCTGLNIAKELLLPGESTSLEALYKPRIGSTGVTRKTISIETKKKDKSGILQSYNLNAPNQLELEINYPKIITKSPEFLEWKAGEEPVQKSIEVTLEKVYIPNEDKKADTKLLEIIEAQIQHQYNDKFTASLEKIGHLSYKLNVTPKKVPIQYVYANIDLLTNDKTSSLSKFSVSARMQPAKDPETAVVTPKDANQKPITIPLQNNTPSSLTKVNIQPVIKNTNAPTPPKAIVNNINYPAPAINSENSIEIINDEAK